MPIALCPECCRDYYLSAEEVAGSRCPKCDRALVLVETLRAGQQGGGEDPVGNAGATPNGGG